MKDLRDLKEDLDTLETEIRHLYRIAGEEATMTLGGYDRWNKQTERLEGILDAIKQDAEMLSEDEHES